jgi:hypothetical protein
VRPYVSRPSVDDGPNLHVLPIVTRGATENLNSLLYLRGVDTASINSDALKECKIQVPEFRRRMTYPLNLLSSELHILLRWQESEFQNPGHGCGLFGPADLQPSRHQC